MDKKIGLMAAAILFLASAVSAQEAERQEERMLVGGELGYSWRYGGYESNLPIDYRAFNITPIFQFFFPVKKEGNGIELATEVGARLAFGSYYKRENLGMVFAFTPDLLFMQYYTNVPYVTPFTGFGIGLDLKVLQHSWGSEAKKVFPRFAVPLKVGVAYNIPNTKLQVYLADKFRFIFGVGFGLENDINVGLLYKL